MVAAARHRLLGRGHCLKGLHQMRAAALVALCVQKGCASVSPGVGIIDDSLQQVKPLS